MLYYFSVEKYLENLYLYKNRNMIKINPELEEDYTVIEEFLKTFSLNRALYTFNKPNSGDSSMRSITSFFSREHMCSIKSTYNLSFFYLKSKYNNRTSILFGRDKKILLNFRELSLKYFENVFFIDNIINNITYRSNNKYKNNKQSLKFLNKNTNKFINKLNNGYLNKVFNIKHMFFFINNTSINYGNFPLYNNYVLTHKTILNIKLLFSSMIDRNKRFRMLSIINSLYKYSVIMCKRSSIFKRRYMFNLYTSFNPISISSKNIIIFIKNNNKVSYSCVILLKKSILLKSIIHSINDTSIIFLMFLSSLLFIYKKKKLINATRAYLFTRRLSGAKLSIVLSSLKFIKNNIYSVKCIQHFHTVRTNVINGIYNFINMKNNGLTSLIYRNINNFDNNFINSFKILNNSFIKFKEFLPFFWDKLLNFNKPKLLFIFINTKQSLIKFLKHKKIKSIKRNRFKTLSFYNNKEYLLV